tara:strand:- start:596 stop:832 length:237 start_codon:yes stop_codon:yes gene_type:complete
MKNVLTHQQEIELSTETRASVYISDYNDAVQITFRDKDKRDETHVIELEIPMDIARSLICELVKDLSEHDEKNAVEET